jgi:choline kinase
VTVRAIILAAGINSRLRNYAIDIPKCLLPIGSSTILERQIAFLIKSGVKRENIIVVSGHMDKKIRMFHSSSLFNSKYKETDNGYSLHIALANLQRLPEVLLEDEVIVLDCDLVYDENLISKVIKSKSRNILVTRKENLSDLSTEEIVILADTGRIRRISRFNDEKSKNSDKTGSNEQFVYTGILKMSFDTATKLDQILCEKEYWTKWYTSAFTTLLEAVEFFNFPLSGKLFCFDVDTKEDYEKISDMVNAKSKNN